MGDYYRGDIEVRGDIDSHDPTLLAILARDFGIDKIEQDYDANQEVFDGAAAGVRLAPLDERGPVILTVTDTQASGGSYRFQEGMIGWGVEDDDDESLPDSLTDYCEQQGWAYLAWDDGYYEFPGMSISWVPETGRLITKTLTGDGGDCLTSSEWEALKTEFYPGAGDDDLTVISAARKLINAVNEHFVSDFERIAAKP